MPLSIHIRNCKLNLCFCPLCSKFGNISSLALLLTAGYLILKGGRHYRLSHIVSRIISTGTGSYTALSIFSKFVADSPGVACSRNVHNIHFLSISPVFSEVCGIGCSTHSLAGWGELFCRSDLCCANSFLMCRVVAADTGCSTCTAIFRKTIVSIPVMIPHNQSTSYITDGVVVACICTRSFDFIFTSSIQHAFSQSKDGFGCQSICVN